MAAAEDATWPVVEFRGNQLASRGFSESDVAAFIRSLSQDLHDGGFIHKLVVADLPLYGDAIRMELLEDLRHTHTVRDQYQGVAKTIPAFAPDGSLKHTVVVSAGVVASALGEQGVEPVMPLFLGRYILHHELAHCVDHVIRSMKGSLRRFTQDGEFSTYQIARYYEDILLAEFAACWLSGKTLTPEGLDFLCNNDADALEYELQRILRMRLKFRTRRSDDLYTLAFESAQCFWFILVQYAKVFGSVLGAGQTAAAISLPPTLASNPKCKAVIDEFAQFLNRLIAKYPEWAGQTEDVLYDLWIRLALGFGFRFVESDNGAELWFD